MSVNTNEVPRHITVMIAGALVFTLNAAHKPQSINEINGIQTMNPTQLEPTLCNTSDDETAGIAIAVERIEIASIILATPRMRQHQVYLFVDVKEQ